jgi:hypothetical protein
MTLTQFLGGIRDHYVKRLARAVRERVTDPEQWLVEHTFGRPEEPDESGWNWPMRHDLIQLKNGEPGGVLVVQTEEAPTFKTFKTQWGDVPLYIEAFTWDQCVVRAQGLNDDGEWEELAEWYGKWFDLGGEKEPGADGLLGVIHAVFKPEIEDDLATLDVDLGSSPVEALEELMDALAALGAQIIALGGPAADEEMV